MTGQSSVMVPLTCRGTITCHGTTHMLWHHSYVMVPLKCHGTTHTSWYHHMPWHHSHLSCHLSRAVNHSVLFTRHLSAYCNALGLAGMGTCPPQDWIKHWKSLCHLFCPRDFFTRNESRESGSAVCLLKGKSAFQASA